MLKQYFLFCCCWMSLSAFAQENIHYEVAFPNAVHHEAEITITYRNVPEGPLELRMSLSSPGRYAIHQFGKNVSQVRATDLEGKPLPIERSEAEMWTVRDHRGGVKVSYTLFADWADGTYSEIDEFHAHLNMPATFMWARKLTQQAISLTFEIPEGSNWRIATQLAATRKPYTYSAPDLAYFLDSPTELSDFQLRQWQVKDGKGEEATFRLVVHHEGSNADLDLFEERVKKNVDEVVAIFGEMPDFDFNTYTFLCDYRSGNDGDGMEHRNSTMITSNWSLADHGRQLLGTVSHEFIHAWNVERLRPRSLEPFNFERPNMSGELWFAEGFTSYYGPLALTRCGVMPLQVFANQFAGKLSYVLPRPGTAIASPVEMSKMAPFVDAATAVDPTAFYNTFTSYYSYGAVIGLALDLEIRGNYPGRSLDDFMQAAWQRYGKTEMPYTNEDLKALLGEVLEDPAFAESFFESFIYGHEQPDYKALLAQAGFRLRKAHPGKASLGMASLSFPDKNCRVQSGTFKGSPLYKAGIDRGDILLSLAGTPLKKQKTLDKVLSRYTPGDLVSLQYQRRNQIRSVQIQLGENPIWKLISFETAGEPVTEEIRAFRKSWLGSKIQK